MSGRRVVAAATLACAVAAIGATLLAQASPARRILETAFRQAYDAADWPKAIEAAERLTLAFPDDPLAHYNLAAVSARGGELGRGLSALSRSAELGFAHLATLRRDEDLDPLRVLPEFAAIVERVEANSARALDAFKVEADRATVLTYLPRGYTPARPAPLLVALHGTGGRAAEIASVYRRVAHELGAILIAPEGVTRSGRGYTWGRVEEGEYLVERAIAEARAKHGVDQTRLVLTGFSEGANLALLCAARRPDLYAGVVAIAGVYEHRVAPVPQPAPGGFPRVYVLAGAQDPGITLIRSGANRLEAAGASVRVKVVDGVGHAFPPNADAELREAFAFVLGS